MTADLSDPDQQWKLSIVLQAPDGQYFLIACRVERQGKHNGLTQESKFSCFFKIFTCAENAALYMCPSSYMFVWYSELAKTSLVKNLVLEKFMLPQNEGLSGIES